jgi:tetratricopeptide (TPR) repeat protein
MTRDTRQKLTIGVATTLMMAVMVMAGCQSGKSNHEKWKQQATQRWHQMRSSVFFDMAKQQYEAGDLKRARKSVQKGLRVDSDNARLQMLAGRIALEKGNLERSFHLFERAVKADKKLAKAHYYKGVVLQRWQQYKEAQTSYQRAYEIKPDEVAYLIARSEMLVQQNQIDQAAKLLEDKRTYFDQNSTIRAALGHLYNMQSRYDRAAVMFKEASLLDPENEKLTEELALAQLAAGQAEQARRTFKQLFATSSQVKRADLRRALANAQVQTGRLKQAEQTYLKLAQSEQGGARDWIRLAELAWQQDQLGATLDAANRVMDEAPQNPRGYMLAGLVLDKRGEIDKALTMFDRAAELAPENAKPLILRGLSLQNAGRRSAAVDAYQKALKRRPDDTRVKQLIATAKPKRS